MSGITDARVLELARKFGAYEPSAKIITIRGDQALLEFARAVLSEATLELRGDHGVGTDPMSR